MSLILPPKDSLAEILSKYLRRTPPFWSFHFAVAWARKRGVELLAEALEAYPGHKAGIVGLSPRGTSYEGLYALYERLDELWVFHKHPFQTFHSKVYLFLPDLTVKGQKAVALIGSSNLTPGGLATNFEASWPQELDPNDPKDMAALVQVQHYFEELVKSPYCHRIDSTDCLRELLEGRYIGLERSLRAGARQSVAQRLRPPAGISLPEAPPPRLVGVPAIPVPLPEVRGEIQVVVEEAEALDKATAAAETLFYVRTLTRNDVLKALRQRAGTWEPDLGLTARNEHPDFWGWPDKYEAVPNRDRMEWHTGAAFHSRILPEGTIESVRLWFRPARPGHPAEHRFRPAARVKHRVIPPELDTASLMVVRRLPEVPDAAFRVDFVLPADPGFDDYARYLTTERPGHRFGYGLVSEIGD